MVESCMVLLYQFPVGLTLTLDRIVALTVNHFDPH